MELVLHHWLRRSWSAFAPLRGLPSLEPRARVRTLVMPVQNRAPAGQAVQLDDFEETAPLVFPMQ